MKELPRIYPGDTVHRDGGWSLVVMPGGKKSAVLYLACGHSKPLETSHEITVTGLILPSVVCTGKHEGTGQLCNFHDHVKLKGWTP